MINPKLKIRAIIVDDEPRIVRLLEQCLQQYQDIEVLAVGFNSSQAYELILKHKPNLVFMDISMPGEDVFEMLSRIQQRDFELVFVTAYDQYALKAFEENALSYLLKPINMQKLETVIERSRQVLENRESDKGINFNYAEPAKINVTTHFGHIMIPAEEIVRCEGDGNYTVIYTRDRKKYMISRQIKAMEDKLSPEGFFRIHKKHLINLAYVHAFDKGRGGNLLLSDGSSVEISYRRKSEFVQLLQQRNEAARQ